MAKQYKCVRCGKPAVVHITRISGNEKLTLHYCEECAKKFSLEDPNIPANLDPEIKKFEETMLNKKHSTICPTCGMLLNDLKKGDKFACPDCYSIIDDSVIELFMQMHNASRHIGKQPKNHEANVDTTSIFEEKTSVFNEDFLSDLEDVVSSAIEQVSGIQADFVFDEDNLPSKVDVEDSSKKKSKKVSKSQSAEDQRKELEHLLDEAVKQERYEDAAKIRDQLNSLPKS